MTELSATAWYVYAVVPDGAPVPGCDVAILPGADLVVLSAPIATPKGAAATKLGALASRVPRAWFETDGAASHAADPDWVAARAAAHHEVVARLAEQCTCLPLGFGTLFSSLDSLRHWLSSHGKSLQHAMAKLAGRAEWSLTLSEDAAAHAAWVARHDADCCALAETVAASGPGTAFLLQRRLTRARNTACDARCQRAADDVVAQLARLGLHFQAEPRDRGAAWSVLAESGQDIAALLRQAAEACADAGLGLRVTGPWPPYAFARAAWQELQDA